MDREKFEIKSEPVSDLDAPCICDAIYTWNISGCP